jgi:hypothetical protein
MYSVAPHAIGRSAEIIADLLQVTVVQCDRRVAASHPGSRALNQTNIDPGHLAGVGLAHTDRR